MSDGDGDAPDVRATPVWHDWRGILRLWAVFVGGVTLTTLVTAPDDPVYTIVSTSLGLLVGILVVIWLVGIYFPSEPDDPPAREVMAHRHVPFPPEYVWALLHPAENAPLTDDVLRGYREPGTPEGVGERQTFVHRWGGRRTTIEVVEFEPDRRAVFVPVVNGEAVLDGPQTVQTVEPDGEGSLLGLGHRMPPDAPEGALLPRESGARAYFEQELTRLAAALERWDGRPPA